MTKADETFSAISGKMPWKKDTLSFSLESCSRFSEANTETLKK